MILLLTLIFCQQPAVAEPPAEGAGRETPRLRVKLTSEAFPAILEMDAWVEVEKNAPAPKNLELHLVKPEGFTEETAPAREGVVKLRVTQKKPGPMPVPVVKLRWQSGKDDTWQEHVFARPLGPMPAPSVDGSGQNQGSGPIQEISYLKITWRTFLIVGLILAAGYGLVYGLLGKPTIPGLLKKPQPESAKWWDKVHKAWTGWIDRRIPLLPGTSSGDLERIWKEQELPEGARVADLARRLDEIRFQQGSIDQVKAKSWIQDAGEWWPLLNR